VSLRARAPFTMLAAALRSSWDQSMVTSGMYNRKIADFSCISRTVLAEVGHCIEQGARLKHRILVSGSQIRGLLL
jgi:hypothetical protein